MRALDPTLSRQVHIGSLTPEEMVESLQAAYAPVPTTQLADDRDTGRVVQAVKDNEEESVEDIKKRIAEEDLLQF